LGRSFSEDVRQQNHKRNLERSIGGRNPAEKPRKGWPGEVWKVASKLLNTEYWRAAERHRSDRRRKIEVTMASERTKKPEEEE
jgi:hypothetical protein